MRISGTEYGRNKNDFRKIGTKLHTHAENQKEKVGDFWDIGQE